MTPLAVLRHGPTPWNAEGRIQGRTDVGLGPEGSGVVSGWRIPERLNGFRWLVSPLRRAGETATLLGAHAEIEPALIEMDWGTWEGQRLADVRAAGGTAVAENEARGLDFRLPGGESPRDIQTRLRPCLAAIAETGLPTVAVTHKGVMRALLALAIDWDMTMKPPIRMYSERVHLFTLDEAGDLSLDTPNIPLVRASE